MSVELDRAVIKDTFAWFGANPAELQAVERVRAADPDSSQVADVEYDQSDRRKSVGAHAVRMDRALSRTSGPAGAEILV